MSSGSWSNLPFQCHLGCVYPNANFGPFAQVVCTKPEGLTTGDNCTYTCGPAINQALANKNMTSGNLTIVAIPGPDGNITRTCQADGLFDGNYPICVNVCSKLFLPQNGRNFNQHTVWQYYTA